ncbi:AzlC family ABC transporter permease [Anaerococcus lactolyticus]|uniref:Branched-chain amino acid transporter n=2 Tax=Anaerococcus lactolyticus TaxID=33032 RepID=A0A095X1L1_9FIRM|nr:AzlC family ABC transporter permease [Anaerococcus lactolyticus]EEI86790.1 putative azaleucine resistance protein AzlC [Anaerococcus lactolyticus ATCC 51172]KGF03940.1 branched-chain amino acid transporter [Anaerococcus lactolyticus S7-1-13]
MKKAFKKAFPYTIPVIIGYLFLGITYGIMVSQAGYNPLFAPLMSMTMYAGSMQFVILPLLKSDISFIAIIILTLSVNIRMMFYGVSLLKDYKNSRSKFLFILTLSDETFAIDTAVKPPEDVNKADFYLAIGIINYLIWIFSSYLGAILGGMINFNTMGMDFVLTALFLVLLVEQYFSTPNHKPLKVGLAIAIASLLIFKPGNFMIPALLLIALSLYGFKDKIEVKND